MNLLALLNLHMFFLPDYPFQWSVAQLGSLGERKHVLKRYRKLNIVGMIHRCRHEVEFYEPVCGMQKSKARRLRTAVNVNFELQRYKSFSGHHKNQATYRELASMLNLTNNWHIQFHRKVFPIFSFFKLDCSLLLLLLLLCRFNLTATLHCCRKISKDHVLRTKSVTLFTLVRINNTVGQNLIIRKNLALTYKWRETSK